MTIHSGLLRSGIALLLLLGASVSVFAQAPGDKKAVWKPVSFAIVKFNEEAPKSWNIYHSEKKGVLLVHLWKRYLLVTPLFLPLWALQRLGIVRFGDPAAR